MNIKRFEVPGLAQYSYMISADRKAAVIDPIRDIERYLAYAEEQGFTITHVLETHIHADFASGAVALAQAAGAELALSGHDGGERYQYAMAHTRLRNGDSVEIGTARLLALHTPGHTPEHLSFVALDTERSETEPMALFSGDFLFVGSVGRPDLLGEEAKHALASELFVSLHERIAHLSDGVEVHPGHGAGSLCGAGMGDRPVSTLGYERKTDPLFRLTREQFVAEILASAPPLPSYYPRMKELNAEGAPHLPSLPGSKAWSAAELRELAAREDVTLLDLRRPEAFGGAHIPGAINIGAGQNLALWAGWMLDPGKKIILIGDRGDDREARRALIRVGLDRAAGYLANGMPAWIDAGLDFEGTSQVPVREIETIARDTLILDVRSDNEWSSGHIENAEHVMLGELPQHLGALPRDQRIVTICGSGYRSSIAASLLRREGFRDVSSMDGGMTAWRAQALPLTMDHR